ncbi:hypothetical protein CF319_g3230 [Tilletia indica]|uniref:Uncharacterized protein n=1 Tax=Tilletia indica TaxID=43049 RepID=A0A177TVQ9_9BASI|nr:hypothetical protein CF319_g3230 [Tilletia indica]KAE8257528.1 hypothetical protein A4X13_0g2287 [Tilletia indica]
MYLLGAHLPDHKLVHIALTNFLGINQHTARRLCARLQLHETAKVNSLTEAQITQLSAFLSSPSSIPARSAAPTTPTPFTLAQRSKQTSSAQAESSNKTSSGASLMPPSQRPSPSTDPLRSLVLEADLRRQTQANIAHHRMVGSYLGRRHAGGLPVRGQRTRTNANTAKKFNRVERRAYSTSTSVRDGQVGGVWAGIGSVGLFGLSGRR